MDKALFKRICRGIGLPVVDWREVRAARWASDPDAVRAELEAFAAGSGETAADGQAGAARQLGRDDARPRPVRARRRPRPGLPPRHAGPRRDATSPGARDLEVAVIGDARGALELYGPGEIVSGHEFYDYAAKYTAGLSETSTRAEVSDRERATILKIARDAYRAIGGGGLRAGRLPGRRRARSSSRRSTRSPASRRSASSRRCRPRAATRSVACAPGSSSSRWTATQARAGRRLTPADLPR